MTVKYEIRKGAYYDSVVLMQLQKALAGLEGVVDAGVVMATAANRELLAANDLDVAGVEAKADDLLIVVKGENPEAAEHAIAQVDALLKRRRSDGGPTDFRPKSLANAAKMLPKADWVLISVPGRYAAAVAHEALDLGKHVFLYSDNVDLADEVKLKERAAELGLLVMGPDCGTAIINGVGLGFANRVRRGNIGVVGASGTGIQAITAEIHNLGGGVSQALGTGGRDLKEAVGGRTAAQGLAALGRDDATDVIVFVSKPPSEAVARDLLTTAQAIDKPVVVNFIGYPPPSGRLGNLRFATSLSEAAQTAVRLTQEPAPKPDYVPLKGDLRGLFSGGTLAYEALLGLQTVLHPIFSNIPIRAEQEMDDVWHSRGHTILDLGEDVFTQGRLHPMMDNDLRLRRLRQEAADFETGLILLDVVLGEGAHPDPAAELAPAIGQVTQADIEVVAIVIGTDEDPQDTAAQIERLREAGAIVYRSVNEAVGYIANRLRAAEGTGKPVALGDEFAAINVGLESFYESVVGQGAAAVQVEWRPPAGGNEKLMGILARMKKGK